MLIDTSFDFRTDASGKDPDTCSPTLRRYHKLLWSKALPGGVPFDLNDDVPGVYLHHRSEQGEFFLSSDSVIPTFDWQKGITELFTEEEKSAFNTIGYTIGGMMVFPGNRIEGKQTINGARGFNRKIADRFDLTLECIRRHYLGQRSPLADTLARYGEFFALFEGFGGYVDFFLLQDLVIEDCCRVAFFMPFDDFNTPSVPKDGDTYREYRRLSIEFVEARNRRIDRHAASCGDDVRSVRSQPSRSASRRSIVSGGVVESRQALSGYRAAQTTSSPEGPNHDFVVVEGVVQVAVQLANVEAPHFRDVSPAIDAAEAGHEGEDVNCLLELRGE